MKNRLLPFMAFLIILGACGGFQGKKSINSDKTPDTNLLNGKSNTTSSFYNSTNKQKSFLSGGLINSLKAPALFLLANSIVDKTSAMQPIQEYSSTSGNSLSIFNQNMATKFGSDTFAAVFQSQGSSTPFGGTDMKISLFDSLTGNSLGIDFDAGTQYDDVPCFIQSTNNDTLLVVGATTTSSFGDTDLGIFVIDPFSLSVPCSLRLRTGGEDFCKNGVFDFINNQVLLTGKKESAYAGFTGIDIEDCSLNYETTIQIHQAVQTQGTAVVVNGDGNATYVLSDFANHEYEKYIFQITPNGDVIDSKTLKLDHSPLAPANQNFEVKGLTLYNNNTVCGVAQSDDDGSLFCYDTDTNVQTFSKIMYEIGASLPFTNTLAITKSEASQRLLVGGAFKENSDGGIPGLLSEFTVLGNLLVTSEIINPVYQQQVHLVGSILAYPNVNYLMTTFQDNINSTANIRIVPMMPGTSATTNITCNPRVRSSALECEFENIPTDILRYAPWQNCNWEISEWTDLSVARSSLNGINVCAHTPSPTSSPSVDPTPSPTMDPSPFPTKSPTPSPTPSPTSAPLPRSWWTGTTNEPTKYPTNKPTYRPTYRPTYEPTIRPTFCPTTDPTVDPTPSPTYKPTHKPTVMWHQGDPSPAPTPSPHYHHYYTTTKTPTSHYGYHYTTNKPTICSIYDYFHPTSSHATPHPAPVPSPVDHDHSVESSDSSGGSSDSSNDGSSESSSSDPSQNSDSSGSSEGSSDSSNNGHSEESSSNDGNGQGLNSKSSSDSSSEDARTDESFIDEFGDFFGIDEDNEAWAWVVFGLVCLAGVLLLCCLCLSCFYGCCWWRTRVNISKYETVKEMEEEERRERLNQETEQRTTNV